MSILTGIERCNCYLHAPYMHALLATKKYMHMYTGYYYTGSEQLFAEVEKFGLINSENKEQEMSHIKRMLEEMCGISSEEVDQECELAAARATANKLQERIELVYLTAQRRHTNIQKLSSVLLIIIICFIQ